MFTLTDEAGRVLIGGPEFEPGQQLTSEQLQGSKPIEVAGATVGWLILSGDAFVPRGGEADFFRRVNTTLLLGAVTAFAVALVAGALAARSLTRPLHDLTEATKAVASGDFERRVEVASPDELGALAAAFNQMSDALAESRRLRRQMTADIAHELRTPLSIILGHLDGVDDGVLKDSAAARRVIREETERLSRLVEDLRTLTLADAGELPWRPSRGGTAPCGLVISATRPGMAKQIGLAAGGGKDIKPIVSIRTGCAEPVSNLVRVARSCTPAEAQIVVTRHPFTRMGSAEVGDSGPGFPPDDIRHVFEGSTAVTRPGARGTAVHLGKASPGRSSRPGGR
jgi:signal transduction histidine kinase